MSKDCEKLAEDFLVTLTWGAKDRSVEILKENPEILNTKKMATTISPDNTSLYNPRADSYNLAFGVVGALCQYRDEGIISKEQFNRTINTPSPETGETLLTSVLKETLKKAQEVDQSNDTRSSVMRSYAIRDLNGYSAILRDLIDQNGKIRADVNVPNLRGQYPLELIQSMSPEGRLHDSLPTEHNCILMATNQAVETKIKYGMTGKSEIEQVDDKALPKTKALILRTGTDPNDPKNANDISVSYPSKVSVLKIDNPTYLASEVKDPLSVARIREPGEYLLNHLNSKPIVYEIDRLNEWHDSHLFLNYGGKWKEIPQEKIYDTVKACGGKSGNEHSL